MDIEADSTSLLWNIPNFRNLPKNALNASITLPYSTPSENLIFRFFLNTKRKDADPSFFSICAELRSADTSSRGTESLSFYMALDLEKDQSRGIEATDSDTVSAFEFAFHGFRPGPSAPKRVGTIMFQSAYNSLDCNGSLRIKIAVKQVPKTPLVEADGNMDTTNSQMGGAGDTNSSSSPKFVLKGTDGRELLVIDTNLLLTKSQSFLEGLRKHATIQPIPVGFLVTVPDLNHTHLSFIIEYIRSGKFTASTPNLEMTCELIVAADKYCLTWFKYYLGLQLPAFTTMENANNLGKFAREHSLHWAAGEILEKTLNLQYYS